jgi:hypothetical protein
MRQMGFELTPGRAGLGAVIVGAIYLVWKVTRKKRVFISYDHSEDANYKRLLEAWDANRKFDFDFDNRSPHAAIDSAQAGAIKAALTTKMKSAEYLLVIVGVKSYTSRWMSWEIQRAKQDDIKLKLAAVRLAPGNREPAELAHTRTSWADGFTRDEIVSALERASNAY